LAAQLPLNTTVGDLCVQALKDAGALGVGQTALAEDVNDAWIRLQWLLQQWERQSLLVYHLVTYLQVSDGRTTPYLVGPGSPDINIGTPGLTARPNRIESAFFVQNISSPNGPIRFSLRLLQSMVDYNNLAMPGLQTFSLVAFYDAAWPNGMLYVWPWPNAAQYSVGVTAREQLPASWPSLTTNVVLPFEYYLAMVSNLAMLLRPKYGLGTFPGDMVPTIAKNSLAVLRKGNTRIRNLDMPASLKRKGLYSIFSDQMY